jgi:chromate transport protein ChrA
MIPDPKTLLGIAAVLMTVAAHIPYFLTTLNGTNIPHIFTWVIWTLLTFIAFAAQVAGNAGPGAWVTGVTGLICVIITIAAFRQGEKHITRGDWIMFIAGLAAIPAWMVTSNPLWSVLIVVAIDASAFWPTFRKSWHRPHQENSFMYGFNVPRHIIALSSMQELSFITASYPAMLLAMNLVMYVMLKTRRKATP